MPAIRVTRATWQPYTIWPTAYLHHVNELWFVRAGDRHCTVNRATLDDRRMCLRALGLIDDGKPVPGGDWPAYVCTLIDRDAIRRNSRIARWSDWLAETLTRLCQPAAPGRLEDWMTDTPARRRPARPADLVRRPARFRFVKGHHG